METKTIIETLFKTIVSEPDQVKVKEGKAEKTVVFEVQVAKQDMGKVIGRKGKNIEALKTIVGAFGIKQNKQYILNLLEEEK